MIFKALILKPLLLKQLTTPIIGPHGITDMIHANQTNHLNELYQINAITAGTSLLMDHYHMVPVLDVAFFISSIMHFRRDMPEIYKFPRYIWSTMLLAITIQKPELFFLYMIMIHVPHHYQMNWEYMKINPRQSFALIVITTLTMGHIGTLMGDNIYLDTIVDLSKGIIISHIAYEELYIHNNETITNSNGL